MNWSKDKLRLKAFIGFGLVFFLLVSGTYVYAATGYIRISLKLYNETSQKKEVVSGIEFRIYQVGTVSEDDIPEFYSEFGIKQYPQTAEDLEKTAKAVQKKINESPGWRGKTNTKGVVQFNDLKKGVYFIEADPINEVGIVTPMIVHIPYFELVNGKLKGPGYSLEIEPKMVRGPGDGNLNENDGGNDPGSDDVTKSSSDSEEEYEEYDENSGQSVNYGGSNNAAVNCPTIRITQKRKTPKTQDTARPERYLIMMAGSMLLMSGVLIKYGRESER